MSDSHVRVVSDNTTVVACIERGGSTKPRLLAVTESIFVWASDRRVSLSAEYLKGTENVTADRLSREMIYSAEWKLFPDIFVELCNWFTSPSVDLFATRLNCQLPDYVSWKPDPGAFRVDAFSFQWDTNIFYYAFPPFSMISRLLHQVLRDGVDVLLVFPVWPTQVWFPTLLRLLAETPVLLPRDCLSLPQDVGASHPLGRRLRLAGVIISGDPSRRGAFRRKLRNTSVSLGDQGLGRFMKAISLGGWDFVSDGKLIHFVRLLM